MRYQVTEQYQRGEERFIASFDVLSDWEIFKAYRIREDETQRRAVLYRVYQQSDLFEVVNQCNLCAETAQYEEGGRIIELCPPLMYRLALRSENVTHDQAYFEYYSDVKLFLTYRCTMGSHLNEDYFFCLYKHDTLIETLPVYTVRALKDAEVPLLTARFNPIPTPTTFKPPGFPQDYWREDEEPDETRD